MLWVIFSFLLIFSDFRTYFSYLGLKFSNFCALFPIFYLLPFLIFPFWYQIFAIFSFPPSTHGPLPVARLPGSDRLLCSALDLVNVRHSHDSHDFSMWALASEDGLLAHLVFNGQEVGLKIWNFSVRFSENSPFFLLLRLKSLFYLNFHLNLCEKLMLYEKIVSKISKNFNRF